MKYYSSKKIDAKKATYNVIFGERSNGKTYNLLLKALKNYVVSGHVNQFAYLRRWKEDVTGRRAARLFAGVVENGEVTKATGGKFTGVHYWAGKFYLCTYDDSGKVKYSDENILGFSFALSDSEHDKSTSFPNVTTIVFDEFLTNRLYLQDEFVLFMNSVSTIVRRREDVKIYMLGNTVNKYCPYFLEMGLTNIQKMNQGIIDVYHYGNSKLTVAVEYCKAQDTTGKEESNKYFAFNNPKLEMITGGAWELNIYPHLPIKYTPSDIIFNFFIEFSDNIYQCSIIEMGNGYIVYIHIKTTPLQDPENDLIYSLEPSHKMNYNTSVYKPTNKLQSKIKWFFTHDKVFYQSNDVGDAINNYLKIAQKV